jgi:hypothetical protein
VLVGRVIERRLVDLEQTLDPAFVLTGLELDRPGADQFQSRQRIADQGGLFAVTLDLLQKIQHLLQALGRLSGGIEEGFALPRLGQQTAVLVQTEYPVVAVLGTR